MFRQPMNRQPNNNIAVRFKEVIKFIHCVKPHPPKFSRISRACLQESLQLAALIFWIFSHHMIVKWGLCSDIPE